MTRLVCIFCAVVASVSSFRASALPRPSSVMSCQDEGGEWPYEVPIAVKSAFDSGSQSPMAGYLGDSVEILLPDCSGIFSKRQAEMLLAKFLGTHREVVYSVDHEETLGDAVLSIGRLSGSGQDFRVCILLQQTGGVQQIKQLRIEEQK